MSGLRVRLCVLVWMLLLWLPRDVAAGEPQTATFAIVVGVNESATPDVTALRYADDDATGYFELFRALGAQTHLLSALDANTQRVHAQAAAEAKPPTWAQLRATADSVAAAVAQARARGLRTELYVTYSGHGDQRDGRGYVNLQGSTLTGEALRDAVVAKIAADRTHLVVDACQSYYLAHARGPGGTRQAVSGFSGLHGVFDAASVGLLLSTSDAQESHEWQAFQGGVFSHEVRSGLYGAADADADGKVGYLELAAFVEHANAAIPNERFRPSLFVRPPRTGGTLLDLRAGLQRRLEIGAPQHGRYLLENDAGVRLADFHSSAAQPVVLLRPLSERTLFLRRLDDDREFLIPAHPNVVALASLTAEDPRTVARGAAHEAFGRLFQLPFDGGVVARFHLPAARTDAGAASSRSRTRTVLGFASLGTGVLAASVATYGWLDGRRLREDTGELSQRDAEDRNRGIRDRNVTAGVLYGVAGGAFVTGALLLLWPASPVRIATTPVRGGGALQVGGTF